jgi:hypothetical protein
VGVTGLLATLIQMSFKVFIDGALLCLLGIAEGQVGGPLNRCMPLKHHMVILILITRVRRVVRWRRRPTSRRCFAGVTPLGGPDHILPVLGPLLTTRVHPEIRRVKKKLDTRD